MKGVRANHDRIAIVEHTPGGRACDKSAVMRLRRFLKHDEMTVKR
ncbi:MAG: hypothetical protein RMK84_13220 [Oscillochloridaceae bacterium]|nr:hypothetical protein [Oscillochloridaceae bacterium]